MIKHHYYKNNKCRICNKLITDNAIYCKSHSHSKHLSLKHKNNLSKSHIGLQTKENHPMWKGGKPSCKICGKKLSNYDAKYCRKHQGESLRKPKNYCLDCNCQVSRQVKRCLKCYRKHLLIQNKTMKRSDLVKHHIFGKKYKDTIIFTSSNHKKLHANAYFYILEKYGKQAILDYIKWFKNKLIKRSK